MVWGISRDVVEDVYEVQVGDLEDNFDKPSHEVFGEIVKRWHDGDVTVPLPGGESLQDVFDRYLPAVDGIVSRYLADGSAETVYLVSHGAVIRLVAAKLAGISSEFAVANFLENTGSIELELVDGGWECRRWGSRVAPFVHDDGSINEADIASSVDDADDPMG